jgi:hypothetical protein
LSSQGSENAGSFDVFYVKKGVFRRISVFFFAFLLQTGGRKGIILA